MAPPAASLNDSEMANEASDCEDDDEEFKPRRVWSKKERPLEQGGCHFENFKFSSDEVLRVSPGCYDMLHVIIPDWSCLSFDILKDDLGACRVEFPHTCYVVCGTQPDAQNTDKAAVHVMKWLNMHKNGDEIGLDEIEDDDDDDATTTCQFQSSAIAHPGVVNRIRSCPQSRRLVATMSEDSKVYVWDIEGQLKALDDQQGRDHDAQEKSQQRPLFTCTNHNQEGFALGWNGSKTGLLASGDGGGVCVLWNPIQGGWSTSSYYTAPSSIEDIEWQPGQADIFASACCDGYVRIHDVRMPEPATIILVAESSTKDINALAWNPVETTCLATGDEAGISKVYDVRFPNSHVAQLNWHDEAITSVSWHPTDSSVVAASSRDDSVSLWDLSVEAEVAANEMQDDVPQQLMFLHMGQTEITEVKFHPQIPGLLVSTAVDGFNAFKCNNID